MKAQMKAEEYALGLLIALYLFLLAVAFTGGELVGLEGYPANGIWWY